MRVGNAVGLPAFRSTNRIGAKYTRKGNRLARKRGFLNAAHLALFAAMMAAKMGAFKEGSAK